MYLFQNTKKKGKGGVLIKRPAVWIFAMLVILFGIYRYFFAQSDDARYYIMEDAFEDKTEAYITGMVHNYEDKEKTVQCILRMYMYKLVLIIITSCQTY